MPPYTPTTHLQDRDHISDTLFKLYYLTDTTQWPRLGTGNASEVFAPTFTLDYTAMFGGMPSQRSPADVVAMWTPIIAKMKATAHVQSGCLVEGLPVPGSSIDEEAQEGEGEVLMTAKAASYVTVHLVQAVEGAEDKMTSNGGINHYEVVKFSEEKCRELYGEAWDGNPWRVTLMRVSPKWYAGNTEIILGEST
jgi:hypothetical protein